MSRRVVLGAYPGVGSGLGLRVALPGRDALSGNPSDLVFDSDVASQMRVHQVGSFEVAKNSSARINFPALGYTPFCLVGLRAGQPATGQYGQLFVTTGLQSGTGGNAKNDALSSQSFIRNRFFSDHLDCFYNVYVPQGTETQGWPNSMIVAYVVYRIPAFY